MEKTIKVQQIKKASEKLSAKLKKTIMVEESIQAIKEFRAGKKELVVHTK